MKNIIKYVFAFFLRILSRAVLRRYKPYVVMVTGSVGKTSTKDAVAAVLSSRFYVRKSEKSFNGRFGVPFTILGVDNPWNNPFAWFSLMKRAIALLLLPNHYPKMLVLEVGADKPGDLAWILRIATPDAVVVTRLPEVPVHVEAYASPEAVREEEFSPAYALKPGTPLIVSTDDPYALSYAKRTSAHLVSFGTASGAHVAVSHIGFYESEGKVAGMRAEVVVGDARGTIVVKGSVGATQVFPAAAAVALALALDIALPDALVALEGYEPPPGRGRLLAGKNGSLIIDDSYNSSPVAVEQGLATLKSFPHAGRPHSAPSSPEATKGQGEASRGRRIAVLGDMLELGRYSVQEHERIATLAHESVDLICAVGIRSRAFAGVEGKAEVTLFDTAQSAAAALPNIVQAGDVILVKGSQSIRTERIVRALLANPADASRLVRQERKWREKK